VTPELTFHEIVSLDDAIYDAWLNLYQTAFPINEQVLVSSYNKVLRDKNSGKTKYRHLLAGLDEGGRLVGMANYDLVPRCRAAVLWYLAVAPKARNRGIGSRFYHEILARVRSEEPSVRALVFEVQDPDTICSAAERKAALRRITFYQRNGAHLLGGVDYTQSVGWQAPIPMQVMVHPLTPDLDPAQAVQVARCMLGKRLQLAGPAALK
jgi:GNAT superfamily N-acetyltransferase